MRYREILHVLLVLVNLKLRIVSRLLLRVVVTGIAVDGLVPSGLLRLDCVELVLD